MGNIHSFPNIPLCLSLDLSLSRNLPDTVIVYIFLSTDKTISLSIVDGLSSNFLKNIEAIPS